MRRFGFIALAAALMLAGGPAAAQSVSDLANHNAYRYALLLGAEEVPAVSTQAIGKFALRVDLQHGEILYELAYARLEGVRAAHLHFAQKGVNGGVIATLCSNVNTSADMDVPACPEGEGGVRGVIRAADILGPASQGIGPGELREAILALFTGLTYANVHTDTFPDGEIRGQVHPRFSLTTVQDIDPGNFEQWSETPGAVDLEMSAPRTR